MAHTIVCVYGCELLSLWLLQQGNAQGTKQHPSFNNASVTLRPMHVLYRQQTEPAKCANALSF